MKTQPALERSEGAVELDPKSTVDVDVTLVVFPRNPKDDLSFGLADALNDLVMEELWALGDDQPQRSEYLAHGLVELRFGRVAANDLVEYRFQLFVQHLRLQSRPNGRCWRASIENRAGRSTSESRPGAADIMSPMSDPPVGVCHLERDVLDALDALVCAYAELADAHDGERVARLFAADGRIVIVDELQRDTVDRAEIVGRAEIAPAVSALRRYRSTHHLLGQQAWSRSSDGVYVGTTYCTAHHTFDHAGQTWDRVMHIRYRDVVAGAAPSELRFTTRTLHVALTDYRVLGAAVALPPVPG